MKHLTLQHSLASSNSIFIKQSNSLDCNIFGLKNNHDQSVTFFPEELHEIQKIHNDRTYPDLTPDPHIYEDTEQPVQISKEGTF